MTKKRYDNAHALRVLQQLREDNSCDGEFMERVNAAANDFDAVLASIKTVVEDDESTESTVDEKFTVAGQPTPSVPRPEAKNGPVG